VEEILRWSENLRDCAKEMDEEKVVELQPDLMGKADSSFNVTPCNRRERSRGRGVQNSGCKVGCENRLATCPLR
jgi:hypothetical protein